MIHVIHVKIVILSSITQTFYLERQGQIREDGHGIHAGVEVSRWHHGKREGHRIKQLQRPIERERRPPPAFHQHLQHNLKERHGSKLSRRQEEQRGCNIDAGSQEARAVSEFNDEEHRTIQNKKSVLTRKHNQYCLVGDNYIVLYKRQVIREVMKSRCA